MIVVKVELHSAITGKVTTIGAATISNTGAGSKTSGNYVCAFRRGRGQVMRGTVDGFPRLRLNVWDLIFRCLRELVGGRNGEPKKDLPAEGAAYWKARTFEAEAKVRMLKLLTDRDQELLGEATRVLGLELQRVLRGSTERGPRRRGSMPKPDPDAPLLFVATTSGYLCRACAEAAKIDLGDPNVDVWREGSHGWTAPVDPCGTCGKAIEVVVGDPDADPDFEPA